MAHLGCCSMHTSQRGHRQPTPKAPPAPHTQLALLPLSRQPAASSRKPATHLARPSCASCNPLPPRAECASGACKSCMYTMHGALLSPPRSPAGPVDAQSWRVDVQSSKLGRRRWNKVTARQPPASRRDTVGVQSCHLGRFAQPSQPSQPSQPRVDEYVERAVKCKLMDCMVVEDCKVTDGRPPCYTSPTSFSTGPMLAIPARPHPRSPKPPTSHLDLEEDVRSLTVSSSPEPTHTLTPSLPQP